MRGVVFGNVLRKAFPERAGAHEIFHSLREVTQSHATRVPCEQGPHAAFVFFQMKEHVEQGGLVLESNNMYLLCYIYTL